MIIFLLCNIIASFSWLHCHFSFIFIYALSDSFDNTISFVFIWHMPKNQIQKWCYTPDRIAKFEKYYNLNYLKFKCNLKTKLHLLVTRQKLVSAHLMMIVKFCVICSIPRSVPCSVQPVPMNQQLENIYSGRGH